MGAPCQISRPVANQSGPFACPCQPSGPNCCRQFGDGDQARGVTRCTSTLVGTTIGARPSRGPGNDRAGSTGKKFSRTRSQASLGDERHLDRLPLNQARPGQAFSRGVDLERHWRDLMQVAISISEGRLSSATLMRRLRSSSRKNRIYKVFREVGCSVRTVALLRYLADPQLRACP